jgi:TPR repeat protein
MVTATGFLRVGCFLAAVLAAVPSGGAGTPAVAQEQAVPSAPGADPAAADANERRKMALALLTANDRTVQERATGLAQLEALVAEGDEAAQVALGAFLLEGYVLPGDPARGAALLKAPAEAGNATAQSKLGEALLWGLAGPPDPAGARRLLEAAAAQDDPEALRVLGEQLLGGWVFARDVPAGLALLERAVALDDPLAEITLGSAYLYGTGVPKDWPRAVHLFEAAAARGRGEGMARYGTMLMWENSDPAKAEAILRRAGALGQASAWSTLAEGAMYGYLGPDSRSKFAEYADQARVVGDDRVAVLEAQRRMWGISQRASGPDTIAGLEDAVLEGNAQALTFLVALVRDGNQWNIRKNPDLAADYLRRFGDLLPPPDAARLAFTIDAARTKQVRDFAGLAARLDATPELMSAWFGQQIYAANPNFAIYVLQGEMRARGIYAGKQTGLATRATLTALGKDCATLPDPARCSDSVMHPEVIGQLLAR